MEYNPLILKIGKEKKKVRSHTKISVLSSLQSVRSLEPTPKVQGCSLLVTSQDTTGLHWNQKKTWIPVLVPTLPNDSCLYNRGKLSPSSWDHKARGSPDSPWNFAADAFLLIYHAVNSLWVSNDLLQIQINCTEAEINVLPCIETILAFS